MVRAAGAWQMERRVYGGGGNIGHGQIGLGLTNPKERKLKDTKQGDDRI